MDFSEGVKFDIIEITKEVVKIILQPKPDYEVWLEVLNFCLESSSNDINNEERSMQVWDILLEQELIKLYDSLISFDDIENRWCQVLKLVWNLLRMKTLNQSQQEYIVKHKLLDHTLELISSKDKLLSSYALEITYYFSTTSFYTLKATQNRGIIRILISILDKNDLSDIYEEYPYFNKFMIFWWKGISGRYKREVELLVPHLLWQIKVDSWMNEALASIWNLTETHDWYCELFIYNLEFISIIQELLFSKEKDTYKLVVNIMGNLASSPFDDIISKLITREIFKQIMSYALDEDPEVISDVLWTFSNMLASTSEITDIALSEPRISIILIGAIDNTNHKVKKETLIWIKQLLCLSQYDIMQKLFSYDLLGTLHKFLVESEHPDVQFETMELLLELFDYGETGKSNTNIIIQEFIDKDGLEAVKDLSIESDDKILRAKCHQLIDFIIPDNEFCIGIEEDKDDE